VVDNIKMDLGEMGLGALDWIDLAESRGQWRDLVNTAIDFWGSINCRVLLQ
jgi:hypothetical protein